MKLVEGNGDLESTRGVADQDHFADGISKACVSDLRS